MKIYFATIKHQLIKVLSLQRHILFQSCQLRSLFCKCHQRSAVKLDANFSGSHIGDIGVAGACDFCPSGALIFLHFAWVCFAQVSPSVRQRQTPFSLKYAFSQIIFFIAHARFNYSNYGFCSRHLSLRTALKN
jgi:hypothetical protein